MSKSKSELSITERLIIELIQYRTSNPKHPTFYGDNENIAKCFDIQTDTARKAVSKLVKLGYLIKNFDKQGRRHLLYSGKPFTPVIVNMNNIDKKLLRNDKEYYEMNFKDAQHELELAKYRIEFLENQTSELNHKLLVAETRVMQLESLLTSKGYTIEQINEKIKQAINSSDNAPNQPTVLPISEVPDVLPKPQTQEVTANDNSSETIVSIRDILKKLNPAKGSLVN